MLKPGAKFTVPHEDGSVVQVAADDLNGDQFPDIVVAWEVGVGTEDQPIQILLNDGKGGFADGSFIVAGALPTVAHPQQIIIAPLQGDSRPDILIGDHGYDAPPFPGHQQRLVEWDNDGKLHDVSATALPQELSFTHRIAVGDVLGNGQLDVLYANLNAPQPQLLLNDGSGQFSLDQAALPSSVTQPFANGSTGGLLVDVDGDSCADLVLGGWDPLGTGFHPAILYLNDGHGDFTKDAPIDLPAPPIALVNGVGPVALDIKSANLDGDGGADLVIDWTNGNYTTHYYQILINHGGGQFVDETSTRLPQTAAASYWTTHIFLASLTPGGLPDLVVDPNGGSAPPTVYANDGHGNFTNAGTFGKVGDIIAPFTQSGTAGFVSIGPGGAGQVYLSDAVACFRAGTRISTSRGSVPVEHLLPGDLVHAHFAGLTPVIWIGYREIDCRRHVDPSAVLPVRVAAGAFAPGWPRRPLLLSPDHAVFVDGVLIPVSRLINGSSVRQILCDVVTYYHVELQRHDVLLAEDMPVESYLDIGNKYGFDSTTCVTPGPGVAALTWEARGCAPLVVSGAAVDLVRRRLDANVASARGVRALGTQRFRRRHGPYKSDHVGIAATNRSPDRRSA